MHSPDFPNPMRGFPYPEPRDIQRKAIMATMRQLLKGKRVVVLELPTGVGKSAVGLTLALAEGPCFYITVQKMLQDQYEREFPDRFAVLKGRNAYECAAERGSNCAEGPCTVDPALRKQHADRCPYTQAAERALNHARPLFNMDSFYYQSEHGWFRGARRPLLVVDEGHLIEDKFMSFIEVRVTADDFGEKPPEEGTPLADCVPYLEACRVEAEAEVEAKKDSPGLTKAEAKRLAHLHSVAARIGELLDDLPKNPQNWVHQWETTRRGRQVLVVKPVVVGRWARDRLFDKAERAVVMSATIVSIEQWCQAVGLERSEVAYLCAGSPFPKENRRIVKRYAGSMSFRNYERTRPKMLRELRAILAEHEGERGIVHTHSYKVERAIRDGIRDPRLTFKNGDVAAMLREHEAKRGSVIVAPGLAEGLDLKDDLSRFQVVCKVPYPSLGDAQMQRRFELSRSYYAYRTMLTLVQEYGRSVRHEGDRAVTYVVDSDLDRFLRQNARITPSWFAEALE